MSSTRRSTQSGRALSLPIEFEDLFEQHWDSICRTLYRLLGDWDEAQDLALETFLQLSKHPPATGRNLGGWLYRVATHLGFNALRAHQRRRKYEIQAGEEHLQSRSSPDPEMEIELKEEQLRVRHILQQMKPRSARLLLLRYSGLSYGEIADALDIAPGSVGTLLVRAEKEFESAFNEK